MSGNCFEGSAHILTDNEVIKIHEFKINTWFGDRNTVIHQAAKIEIEKKNDWNDFLEQAEKTAKNGRKIFDSYNKQLKKLRKKIN
jgi:predicted nucleic-acid-binding protein